MSRKRRYYMASGCLLGLTLLGLGWGLCNFYLVAAGALAIAASVTWLTIPMPTIL